MAAKLWSKRAYIDFALKKRAIIASIYRGLNTTSDACDADPYLRRAAKHHGQLSDRDCPMCHKDKVHELNTHLAINSDNTQVASRLMKS